MLHKIQYKLIIFQTFLKVTLYVNISGYVLLFQQKAYEPEFLLHKKKSQGTFQWHRLNVTNVIRGQDKNRISFTAK